MKFMVFNKERQLQCIVWNQTMETRQKTYVKCLIASVKINVMGAYADGKWISEKCNLLPKTPLSWYKQTTKPE